MTDAHVQLWENLLKDSSKRIKQLEGTIVLIGDHGCGKTKLLQRLCPNTAEKLPTEIISYNYFNIFDTEESQQDLSASSRVNVWSVNEDSYCHMQQVILNPSRIDRLSVAVTVDVSIGDACVESARKWLALASDAIVKFAQNTHLTEPVPLLVVGCKSDALVTSDIESLKRAKTIQGELRALCMKYHASLFYCSSEQNTNIRQLQHYILHRFFPESFTFESVITNGTVDVIVPEGADNAELIMLATDVDGAKFLEYVQKSPEKKPPQRQAISQSSSKSDVVATLIDEQEWLQQMGATKEVATRDTEKSPTLESKPSMEAPKTKPTRRASTAGGAKSGNSNEAVRGFFENLLTSNPTKK